MRRIALLLGVGLVALGTAQAFAGEVSVAVAANFTKPAEEILDSIARYLKRMNESGR